MSKHPGKKKGLPLKAHKYWHSWTKAELKLVCQLWTTHSLDEISSELGLTKQQISYAVTELRRSGAPLPRKYARNQRNRLFKEAAKEVVAEL